MITKQQKTDLLEIIEQKFQNASSLAFTEYSGMTVAQMTKLRRLLRDVDAEFRVYKNTLAKIAVRKVPGGDGVCDHLKGTTAVAIAKNDPAAPFKVLNDFINEKENKALKFKVGLLEGVTVDASRLEQIANIPPREVLLGQIASGLMSPISGFVNCLAGTLRGLVNVLDAVKKQKEENA